MREEARKKYKCECAQFCSFSGWGEYGGGGKGRPGGGPIDGAGGLGHGGHQELQGGRIIGIPAEGPGSLLWAATRALVRQWGYSVAAVFR